MSLLSSHTGCAPSHAAGSVAPSTEGRPPVASPGAPASNDNRNPFFQRAGLIWPDEEDGLLAGKVIAVALAGAATCGVLIGAALMVLREAIR